MTLKFDVLVNVHPHDLVNGQLPGLCRQGLQGWGIELRGCTGATARQLLKRLGIELLQERRNGILWPLIEEFCELYPGIQPDVLLEDRIGNWVEDRVDVGFRLGPSPDEGVIARRLFPLQLVICGAPAYFERFGVPKSLAALSSHRCSVFRHPGTGRLAPWHVHLDGQLVAQPVVPAIISNDVDLELNAVLSGKVLGQLAGATAAAYIRSGHLVPVLLEHMPDIASYFVYFGSRTSQPARARAFIDLAVKRLTDCPQYVLTSQELAHAQRLLPGLRRQV